jgi:hypothetical protein
MPVIGIAAKNSLANRSEEPVSFRERMFSSISTRCYSMPLRGRVAARVGGI